MCSSKKLCENEDCKICFENSFASHERSKYWSDKNELKPRQVFKVSGKKIWFNCDCGHDFESLIAGITGSNRWCSYCANQKLCNNNDCQQCFNKSFASYEKSKYWSDQNEVKPRQIYKSTNKKFWFNCSCGHIFISSPNIINTLNRWCPYCCNPQQKLCNNNECKKCFEKSFASHEKSKYWSDKNELKPREVFKFSEKKYWFHCNNCNYEFITSLHSISGKNVWCPICVNKTEKKLYDKLLEIYPDLITQFRADWCKNSNTNYHLPFDLILEEQKIIIELDGPQHFVQVRNWKSPDEHFKIDKYKEKCANENGYSIIRLLQEDVLYDKYDWLTELNENITKIINDTSVKNIYMCKNNEYNSFIV